MKSNKFKKLVAALALTAMSITMFAGCGKENDPVKSNEPVISKPAEDVKKEEVVTLKWVQVGSGMPANYDKWKENIDKYLEEKIGVNIDVEVVSWGDWDNRRNVIVNSGEAFDILFTNVNNYTSDIAVGAYYDITSLVKEKAPDLYKYIPEMYWDATKVNGKIYSVPTYKDSSVTHYFVWDKVKAEKYNIDYNNIHDLVGLDAPLKTLKEKEGSPSLILSSGGFYQLTWAYDGAGAGVPIGVRYDDDSRKVVSIFEQPDVMSQLEYLHKWYKEGIINADAPALAEGPAYKPLNVAQGWKSAAKTVWGPQLGVEAEAIEYSKTVVSNESVRGSLSAISANTKYPEKCLEFLQLINLDPKVRDAFYYGLEGDNFEYIDGKVKKLNEDWKMAGYTQGTFFTVSQRVEDAFNQWDEVKKLNEAAERSVLLGFTTDTSSIENEIANCNAIYKKYTSELLTGAKEPKELVAKMRKELDAAGFKKIMETVQAQIDKAFAK